MYKHPDIIKTKSKTLFIIPMVLILCLVLGIILLSSPEFWDDMFNYKASIISFAKSCFTI